MSIKTLHFPFFLLLTIGALGQQDSIPQEKLKEVVITGQYNPQSVKKSVYQVEVISRADIDRQAGNNLADLLNQSLNITVMPSSSTGKSTVEMFGLNSQYIKILVDNVPVINDEGLGNFTDLTQINLDDIQQIEIVKGSMGVEYGANAVAGIINIITKKSSKYKWEVTPYLQEETIGKEYNGINKGRHIQSVRVGHNINPKWYTYATFTHNDFDGFLNNKQGQNHLFNDGLRGYEWLPKDQIHAKAYLGFTPNTNHRFFYRFEFFDEETKYFNDIVDPNYNPATDTDDPIAADDIYGSQRFVHLFNAAGKFTKGLTYDFYLSYQQQTRDIESFQYRIRTGEKFDVKDFEYESRKAYFTKGSLSNFLDSDVIDFQVGYEVNEIHGYASSFAGEGMFTENIKRTLGTYDVYGSTEINIGKRFSVRPGARALFSSKFDTMTALSLSAKYDLGNGYDLRGILGTCPKLPTYEELYTYFVDVNHNVQGNPNLQPENGISAFLHLNKIFKSGDKVNFDTIFSTWYLNVRDRIELVAFLDDGLRYQYGNIDIYRTYGASLTSQMTYGNLGLNAGFTFSGVSKVLDSAELSNDDYLHSVQANGNAFYRIPKWGTTLSAYIKYNGPEYQFVTSEDLNGDPVIVRGKRDSFTSVDATVSKSFDKDRFQVTLGARNLTDIKRINTNALQGGAHEGAGTSVLLGYGRSYFLKLLYKFNFG
ncbi:TonB-dependent receptor plug domain-containing protein [Flavobacterium sp. MAH-1]|uniref:TonB-dependent receptor plug domain-containing protein n=1 Tax=Flavobacterium agri TaxID=2743471 RepID=A0A7Y9C717_9FLAO|nr:TonB-dependent receptor plug domain-containing protein [Flavobacterium agri]NUY80853.1 TonB-dependent receptor plug domain-containing protein [Flavobacterium agri]NYA70877.1 TonB-dependent receptor plug domain-containing protein [Flavobacterium agri]